MITSVLSCAFMVSGLTYNVEPVETNVPVKTYQSLMNEKIQLTNEEHYQENLESAMYILRQENPDLSDEEIYNMAVEATPIATTSTTDEEPYDLMFGSTSGGFWSQVTLLWTTKAARLRELLDVAIGNTTIYYGRNQSDDTSDAFRHVYFIALVTNEYGADFAEDFIACYDGYNGSDSLQILRESMDEVNNSVGITVGQMYLDEYINEMPYDDYENLADFSCHACRFGSAYGVVRIADDQMGFRYTVEGEIYSGVYPLC